MNEIDDRQLDELLTSQLADELDPHVGKAERAFAERAMPQHRRRAVIWSLAVGISAVAATVAVVLLYPHLVGRKPMTSPTQPNGSAAIAANGSEPFVERAIAWQTSDEGTVMLGDKTPARRVRQTAYEQVRWHDPTTHAEMQITIPHERLIFVEMETY